MQEKYFWHCLVVCFMFSTLTFGCATLTGGGTDLELTSEPNGANVIVYDRNGKIIQETVTPATVSMSGERSPFSIEIAKENYTKAIIEVKKGFNIAYLGNIPLILVSGIGLVGLVLDPLSGATVELTPNPVNAILQLTPEAIASQEAQQRAEAEIRAREEAEKAERDAADAKARAIAAEIAAEREAIAREAKFNPNKFDRSQYKEITVEDFSFDMVTGKFNAGTKISFKAKFLTKPTGTNYRFKDINSLITLSTTHNFVRDMPDRCFNNYQDWLGRWQSQDSVEIFVTVKKTGQSGECSVDIVEW
jgi:hypothetical protein